MIDAEKMNKGVKEAYTEVNKMFNGLIESMSSQRDIVLNIVSENGELKEHIKKLQGNRQAEEIPECMSGCDEEDIVCTCCKYFAYCKQYAEVCRELEKKDKQVDELIKRSADLASRLHKAETEVKTLKEGAEEDKPKCFGDSCTNDECCYCDVFIECAILAGVKHGKS